MTKWKVLNIYLKFDKDGERYTPGQKQEYIHSTLTK